MIEYPVGGTMKWAAYLNGTDESVTLHFEDGDVVVNPWTDFTGNASIQSHTLLRPVSAEALLAAMAEDK